MRSGKGSSSQHEALDDYLRTDELIALPTAGPRDGRRDPHDQSNGCETLGHYPSSCCDVGQRPDRADATPTHLVTLLHRHILATSL